MNTARSKSAATTYLFTHAVSAACDLQLLQCCAYMILAVATTVLRQRNVFIWLLLLLQ
jgi:hypothetical protein